MEQVLFGERLKNAREASGLSRDAMANRVGVKLDTVEKWESGKVEPRANRLQTLASLLSVPLLWLLAGSQQVPVSRVEIAPRELLLQKIDELGSGIEFLKSELEELRLLAENCN